MASMTPRDPWKSTMSVGGDRDREGERLIAFMGSEQSERGSRLFDFASKINEPKRGNWVTDGEVGKGRKIN